MEANVAYYCLHEFLELDRYERAFVIAAVMIKLKNDKKEAKKAKSRKKR